MGDCSIYVAKTKALIIRGNESLLAASGSHNQQHLGHMTKMAATPIFGKNPSTIFSGTDRRIFMTLCIRDSLFK